jgi:hypothetical protein
MAEMGLEYPPRIPGNTRSFRQGGAESGAVRLEGILDPDLAALVEAWPTLPDALKSAILTMLRAASQGS